MTTTSNKKKTSTQLTLVNSISIFQKAKEEIQVIIQHWIRILNIKLGWIHDFDQLVVNYITMIFTFDTFCPSSKLLNTFTGHTGYVNSVDYFTFDNGQFICSGSSDKTVRMWDVDNNKQIQSFNGHSDTVNCVKFSQYIIIIIIVMSFVLHRMTKLFVFGISNIIDNCKHSMNTLNGLAVLNFHHLIMVDIYVLDLLMILSVYGMLKHPNYYIFTVDIHILSNNIGVIGGNGYTICSGSWDDTIRIWDIETTKQSIILEGHENWIIAVKYGSNELANTVLSGSFDSSICLWDIRSGQRIQVFNGHTNYVHAVEYSPFVIKNSSETVNGNSNVICSGSSDNTIRFWDIRSNKNELYVIKGDGEDNGIFCLKFIPLKKQEKKKEKQ
ncbi:WD-repeat protein [Reticulomyxa filosa]|uniref:WD-repeat protein n=1 Tax=Reticulomyxa filosa TaxID=46433 RepID=X6LE33_RETFI|nr:WD-repeat protein [Reticulomyxa filosa]|eukprot:ETN98989.1 WD-repeat protein [Reticulomyxa filosa]